jgi:hypothetical protein
MNYGTADTAITSRMSIPSLSAFDRTPIKCKYPKQQVTASEGFFLQTPFFLPQQLRMAAHHSCHV